MLVKLTNMRFHKSPCHSRVVTFGQISGRTDMYGEANRRILTFTFSCVRI
jgi:hypothetical protein